jgi:hypothetical protein
VIQRLTAPEWRARARQHEDRADALTAGRRARRLRGQTHAVEDFLYDYYNARPAQLRRWHPGAGAVLEADDAPIPHAAWRWYATDDVAAGPSTTAGRGTTAVPGTAPVPGTAVGLDTRAFLADRGDTIRYIHGLLTATAARPAFTGCLGLHEWAMVYRQAEHRHTLPLRLGQAGTDDVVEAHPVRCSHFDAFRFFTPAAIGRNRLQPTRATQPALEQPGCLHANMDCFKWALKLGPAVPGELLLDAFELAAEIRLLDMQASPYDVSSYGLSAVAIETPDGKAEYVRRQRVLATRTQDVRRRLVAVCEQVLASGPAAIPTAAPPAVPTGASPLGSRTSGPADPAAAHPADSPHALPRSPAPR